MTDKPKKPLDALVEAEQWELISGHCAAISALFELYRSAREEHPEELGKAIDALADKVTVASQRTLRVSPRMLDVLRKTQHLRTTDDPRIVVIEEEWDEG